MFESVENAYDFGPNLDEVVTEYLKKNSPYTPYTDNRIRNTTD